MRFGFPKVKFGLWDFSKFEFLPIGSLQYIVWTRIWLGQCRRCKRGDTSFWQLE